jgi:hypothetical protein
VSVDRFKHLHNIGTAKSESWVNRRRTRDGPRRVYAEQACDVVTAKDERPLMRRGLLDYQFYFSASTIYRRSVFCAFSRAESQSVHAFEL